MLTVHTHTTHSITVLSFLSELLRDERQRPLLNPLLVALFDKAAATDVRKTQLAGSAAFSIKLRWATLVLFCLFGML